MGNFKYKYQIEHLLSLGFTLPNLSKPNNKVAFRFIFKDKPAQNHIPQYIKKPRRALTEIEKLKATTSGYALSCFEQESKAKSCFTSLAASIPQIRKTIGDSLSSGVITDLDGLISDVNVKTSHFDLYEYCQCNLSNNFNYLYSL